MRKVKPTIHSRAVARVHLNKFETPYSHYITSSFSVPSHARHDWVIKHLGPRAIGVYIWLLRRCVYYVHSIRGRDDRCMGGSLWFFHRDIRRVFELYSDFTGRANPFFFTFYCVCRSSYPVIIIILLALIICNTQLRSAFNALCQTTMDGALSFFFTAVFFFLSIKDSNDDSISIRLYTAVLKINGYDFLICGGHDRY